MDKKYICKNCLGCQAQENKIWQPKMKCENFRSDSQDHISHMDKMVYEQLKIKAP